MSKQADVSRPMHCQSAKYGKYAKHGKHGKYSKKRDMSVIVRRGTSGISKKSDMSVIWDLSGSASQEWYLVGVPSMVSDFVLSECIQRRKYGKYAIIKIRPKVAVRRKYGKYGKYGK